MRKSDRSLLFPDLIRQGNVGLMKAVDKLEYRRGYTLSTYATCKTTEGLSFNSVD